jgi:hypothetical protein
MAVYVSNVVIEQGFDFDTSFQLEDTRTNSFLDLTGYTPVSKLRKHYGASTSVSFASTITNAELGIVQISLGSSETAELKPGRYVYDVQLSLSDSDGVKKYKAVEGAALVRGGVTR